MAMIEKEGSGDARSGYARDFVEMIGRGAGDLIARKIRVVANAGGVNPTACRDAVAKALSHPGIKIGVVAGDDILDSLDGMIARGVEMRNLDTGEALESIRARVQSANVYFGAAPIADSLGQGAQVVITGRCTDTGLVLGPILHEFGWARDDWDKLAAGTIAGHTVECGAPCTGA